jgi:hypothetical protein
MQAYHADLWGRMWACDDQDEFLAMPVKGELLNRSLFATTAVREPWN